MLVVIFIHGAGNVCVSVWHVCEGAHKVQNVYCLELRVTA